MTLPAEQMTYASVRMYPNTPRDSYTDRSMMRASEATSAMMYAVRSVCGWQG